MEFYNKDGSVIHFWEQANLDNIARAILIANRHY